MDACLTAWSSWPHTIYLSSCLSPQFISVQLPKCDSSCLVNYLCLHGHSSVIGFTLLHLHSHSHIVATLLTLHQCATPSIQVRFTLCMHITVELCIMCTGKSQIVISINDAELRQGLSTQPPKITQIWNEEMKYQQACGKVEVCTG